MEERIWTTQKLTRLDRFEGLRKENGLTLEQLAERTGLSSSGASNNIMGRQKMTIFAAMGMGCRCGRQAF